MSNTSPAEPSDIHLEQRSLTTHGSPPLLPNPLPIWLGHPADEENGSESDEDSYAMFVEGVVDDEIPFYPLTPTMFVVPGWNRKSLTCNKQWYHLQVMGNGDELVAVCMCPHARAKVDGIGRLDCIHICFVLEFSDVMFLPSQIQVLIYDEEELVLFSRQQERDPAIWTNYFSVPSSDRNQTHIGGVVEILVRDVDTPALATNFSLAARATVMGKSIVTPRQKLRGEGSVSYLPIPPPIWARISMDLTFPSLGPPLDLGGIPSPISLSSGGSCCCTDPRPKFDKSRPMRVASCIVYTTNGTSETKIEVQLCTACSRRQIGPDCQNLGWFAFVKLQQFEADMQCPVCGPTPEDTIWDGVMLAYGEKYLLPSLHPPTVVSETAPQKQSRYTSRQQAIPDQELHEAIRKICQQSVASLLQPVSDVEQDEGDDEDEEEGEKSIRKGGEAVIEGLSNLSPALGHIFKREFGIEALHNGLEPKAMYQKLFLNLTAEESVLQMSNRLALQDLVVFIQNPHGGDVFLGLTSHNSETPEASEIELEEENWQETGCYYSMPAIRLHPSYPHLTHDLHGDNGKRGQKCSKYWSIYGKQKLTGGLMCIWCSHSICYGFHCIPNGEGHNDVFSPIITREREES
ncbi:uncharacterized protein LACBIDRAFT_334033 [Laccaria bicolor S238N-H82]|uniref:Predicted protein n=1 Tax=Laccaria bicolor (strain S238N-H82 / ATCC MYA-4686) TaxID=486041 RepID=B0DXV4_LACBS|nr:uncharacterized protein LACBIDRAFT_334033 [Laccaria bicolor S238N-H82]EDR00577.1 predicted protein [Laccaria bicolor S238N-H82]|eukprot:XP_001888804.1 predicted protein [Laccaria bicolor S238N-H82]